MQNYIHGSGKGEVQGLELGSIYVIPEFRSYGVAKVLVEKLVGSLPVELGSYPIFAVVTADNLPSRKLFEKLKWTKQSPTTQQTNNFQEFYIGNANIFDGWGKPSFIYWYNQSL